MLIKLNLVANLRPEHSNKPAINLCKSLFIVVQLGFLTYNVEKELILVLMWWNGSTAVEPGVQSNL